MRGRRWQRGRWLGFPRSDSRADRRFFHCTGAENIGVAGTVVLSAFIPDARSVVVANTCAGRDANTHCNYANADAELLSA